MKKRIVTVLLLAVALSICACAKTEQPPTNAPTKVQMTTEAPRKTLTADEVVALFNAKYDLFSETCEFDAEETSCISWPGGGGREVSFSEKCKYIDGKVNYTSNQDGIVDYIWDDTYFKLDSQGKVIYKLDITFEQYFPGHELELNRRIDSYTDVEQTETDAGTEYFFKLPDKYSFGEVLCNREAKIIVDNSGNLSYYEYSVTYVPYSEYEQGKSYPHDGYEGEIKKVKFYSTENVQIDLSQYEEEINSFVPAD